MTFSLISVWKQTFTMEDILPEVTEIYHGSAAFLREEQFLSYLDRKTLLHFYSFILVVMLGGFFGIIMSRICANQFKQAVSWYRSLKLDRCDSYGNTLSWYLDKQRQNVLLLKFNLTQQSPITYHLR